MTWPEVRMSLAHSFLSQGHRTTSGNKIHSKDDWLRQVTESLGLCLFFHYCNDSSGGNEHARGPASSSVDGSSISIQALLRHDRQRLSSQCQCLPGWFTANIDERCRNRVDQLAVSQLLDRFASSISRCSPLQDTMVTINTSSYAECTERCGTCLHRSGLGQFSSKELIDQTTGILLLLWCSRMRHHWASMEVLSTVWNRIMKLNSWKNWRMRPWTSRWEIVRSALILLASLHGVFVFV